MTAPAAAPGDAAAPARVARLSYFFPAHNEEANLEGLVAEALETLPSIAETFEIIAVDDGIEGPHPRRSRTASPPSTRTSCASSTTTSTAATAARCAPASRRRATSCSPSPTATASSGSRTSRASPGASAPSDRPDVVVGYRIKRADPVIRVVYARTYKLANRIFFGLRVRDVDCACKLFRREALDGVRVESGGAFFSAELLIKVTEQRSAIAEVGVPHYPRTAGSPTGAKPSVIWRAVKDFWMLRLRLWANAGPRAPPGPADPGRASPRSPAPARHGDRRPRGRGCSRTRGRCRASWGPGSPRSPRASPPPGGSGGRLEPPRGRPRPPRRPRLVLVLVVVGQRGGLVEDLRGRVDRALEPDGQGDRVRRARVELVAAVRGRPAPAGRGRSPRRATR